MKEFTHWNDRGEAVMVDISGKQETAREAAASGTILMSQTCYEKLKNNEMEKGDVLGAARIAGILGAKKTAELIPLCHSLNLSKAELNFQYRDEICGIEAECIVKVTGRTGVEMEALTGVSLALLTIYDMCKAVDKGMKIGEIQLVRKSGGESGPWKRGIEKRRAEDVD